MAWLPSVQISLCCHPHDGTATLSGRPGRGFTTLQRTMVIHITRRMATTIRFVEHSVLKKMRQDFSGLSQVLTWVPKTATGTSTSLMKKVTTSKSCGKNTPLHSVRMRHTMGKPLTGGRPTTSWQTFMYVEPSQPTSCFLVPFT